MEKVGSALKKELSLIAILLFVNTSIVFASMDTGYRIRVHSVAITVRFVSDSELKSSASYLSRSDGLFWDILTWMQNNESLLAQREGSIMVEINYKKKIFSLYSLETQIVTRDRMPVWGHESSTAAMDPSLFAYNTQTDLTIHLFQVFAAILGITPVKNNPGITIRFFVISAPPHEAVVNQDCRTDIFFGPFPGSMFNYSKKVSYIVFWKREDAIA
jgi:hypothetical protein